MAFATVTACVGFNDPANPGVTPTRVAGSTAVMLPVDSVSGPPEFELPSAIVCGEAPPVLRLPVVKADNVQPAKLPRLSCTCTVPIVVENDDALPSVPDNDTEPGTDSDNVLPVRVTVRLESPHEPPPGGAHAKAGRAGRSATEHTATALSAPSSFTAG